MDFEVSDASDRDVVEDSAAETKTTSEDSTTGESSSTDENEEQMDDEPKSSKPGNETTAVDRNSPGLTPGNQSVKTVLSTEYKPSGNSGPDSVDANAAERIKSTTLRRQRKQVERFAISSHTTTRDRNIVIPDGSGTKLQDIPYIAEQINKHRSADLTKVHRFIFGKAGAHSEVKKHLRMFTGFAFTKGSEEYEKKKQALNKMEKMGRDILCDCLGLSKSGTKEVSMERILEFLIKPSSELVKGKGAISEKAKRKSPSASPSKKKSPSKSKSKDDTSQDDASKEEQSDDDDDNEEPKSSKTKKKLAVKKTKSIEPSKDKPKVGRKRVSAQSKKRKMPEPDDSSEEEQEKPKKRPKPIKVPVASSSENESPPEASSLVVKKNGLKNVGKKLTPGKPKASPTKLKKPAPKVPSFNAKKKTNTKSPKKTKQTGKRNAKNTKKSSSQSDNDNDNDNDEEDESNPETGEEEALVNKDGELNDFKIRKIVKQILDESDLRQVSMKSIIEQVMASFDLVNVDENKVRIKEIVNEFLDF